MREPAARSRSSRSRSIVDSALSLIFRAASGPPMPATPASSCSVASASSSSARKPMRYMLRAMTSVTPPTCWSAAMASSSICLNLVSLMMSSFQSGELGGETHVLPLAADGEAQLLVGDDQLHPPVGLVDDDLVHLGRLDGRAHEARGVAVEGDDVDLLAAKLLHDRLHARSLHPDARAHRVDVGVAAASRRSSTARRARGRRRRRARCPRRSPGTSASKSFSTRRGSARDEDDLRARAPRGRCP